MGGVNELVIEHLFGFITASMETLIDQTADMLLDAMAGSYERYRASRQAAETAAT